MGDLDPSLGVFGTTNESCRALQVWYPTRRSALIPNLTQPNIKCCVYVRTIEDITNHQPLQTAN